MAIFTAWANIYSAKYFCDARVAGLGKLLSNKKIFNSMVLYMEIYHIVGNLTSIIFGELPLSRYWRILNLAI